MEVKLNTALTIIIAQEEISKLIEELNWLAGTYDYGFETILNIREELLKQTN